MNQNIVVVVVTVIEVVNVFTHPFGPSLLSFLHCKQLKQHFQQTFEESHF